MAKLIWTKHTRLEMDFGGMSNLQALPRDQKLKEIEYIANTIPSSHEFLQYTFLITGVTRACANQITRTRTASFAQQTLRMLDVGAAFEYETGPSIEADYRAQWAYDVGMKVINFIYRGLIKMGVKTEDARGILPLNILTNLCMGINLRNFVALVQKRSSSRVQSEYRDVVEGMKAAALEVHPFATLFFDRTFDRAVMDLEALVLGIESEDERARAVKLLDQIRSKQGES